MKDIERFCQVHAAYIQNISFTQYWKIVYYLFTNGNVNLGRVIALYHFTKIIMKGLMKN